MAVEFRNRVASQMGVEFAVELIFEHPSPGELAGHLAQVMSSEEPEADSEVTSSQMQDDAASGGWLWKGFMDKFFENAFESGFQGRDIFVSGAGIRFREEQSAGLKPAPPKSPSQVAVGGHTDLYFLPSFVPTGGLQLVQLILPEKTVLVPCVSSWLSARRNFV